ncbi:MAG: CHASE domain-containing protein [Verrucomicrobiae bacterium]
MEPPASGLELLADTPAGRVSISSRGAGWALALLLAGLLATALVARYEKAEAEKRYRLEFDSICKDVQAKIESRLDAHEQILRSGAAFFADSDGVTRDEWREFSERQKISQKLPGIQGIGFALLVPPSQLAQHIEEIRAEGFPDYQVKPAGEREAYSPIIFLEPFSGRNLRAFGYDMLSEPIRRAAMERARDQDEAVLSGRVTLVQETSEEIQAGTLMYVPVYRMGEPHETVAERRAALLGWVYSPYRMDDLMAGILRRWDLLDPWRIHLKIFDGEPPSPEALLYDSQPGDRENPASLQATLPVDAAGRRWLLSFSQAGEAGINYSIAWLAWGSGTTISLLLSSMLFLLFSLINTRFNAQRLAERLIADLRAIEERYALTFDAVNDGLWDWNVPTGNAFFSPHYYSMLGYGNEEFPASYASWRTLVHPDDIARVEGELQRSVETGTGFAIDLQMKEKSGKWKWVSTRGNVVERDAGGKALRMVGVLSDITERKRAEVDLRESEGKFIRSVEFSPYGIFFYHLDEDGDLILVGANPSAERIIGISQQSLIGKTIEEAFPGLASTGLPAMYRKVASGDLGPQAFEIPANDERFSGVYDVQVFQIGANHIAVDFIDITARKRAEEEIRTLNAELEQRVAERTAQLEATNKELEAFSYSVSHDLRAPLRHVQGYVDMLEQEAEGQLSDRARHYMQTISAASGEMGVLIDELLAFSRMGRAEMVEARVNLDSLVRNTLRNLEAAALGRNIVWTIPPLPEVQADPSMLKLALANLLGNALKFTRPRDPAQIEIGCAGTEDGRVILFVRDNGVGFDPQYASKLFGVFQRLHREDEFEGIGIGLANVRRIISRHGGRTWAESKPDAGSTFYFTLTAASPTNPTSERQP